MSFYIRQATLSLLSIIRPSRSQHRKVSPSPSPTPSSSCLFSLSLPFLPISRRSTIIEAEERTTAVSNAPYRGIVFGKKLKRETRFCAHDTSAIYIYMQQPLFIITLSKRTIDVASQIHNTLYVNWLKFYSPQSASVVSGRVEFAAGFKYAKI